MTRTSRAAYPRALNRDRSESRTGLDNSLRKGGAGGHNWGSLADERYLEANAVDDEGLDLQTEQTVKAKPAAPRTPSPTDSSSSSKSPMERNSSGSSANSVSLTEEDKEKARQLRKNAFKKGEQLDLAAIARSSAAVSSSPPDSDMARRLGSDNSQVTI